MAQIFTNNARSTLAGSITNVDTSMAVQALDAAKFPSPGAGDFFLATLVDGSLNREIVKVTNRTGVTLTVVRGQEGTTPFGFASGANIDCRLTAGTIALFTLGPVGPVVDNAATRTDGTGGNAVQSAPLIIEDNGDIHPETNDVGALGTDAKRWADVKLAIGAKINLGADVEFVHSTGKLTQTVGAFQLNGAFTASGGGALTGTWTSLGTVTTVDINGGTMDGVVIGGAVKAALGATTGTFTGAVTVADGSAAAPGLRFTGSVAGIFRTSLGGVGFSAAGAEAARITGSAILIGLTTSGTNTPGASIFDSGLIQHTVTNNIAHQCNRTNDGTVAQFGSAGTFEGNISIAGSVCTYGTFFGSHISQLLGGAARIDILRGTIVATVDEMCVWGIVEYLDHNGETVRDEGVMPADGKIGDVFDFTYSRIVKGTRDVAAEYQEVDEQAFEDVDIEVNDIEIRNGRAYQLVHKAKQRLFLFDEVPLFTAGGEPVMRLEVLEEGAAPVAVPQKLQIPRMVKVRKLVAEAHIVDTEEVVTETANATIVQNANVHLPRFRIATEQACERPYGVFGWWDDDDKAHTADATIGALGTYVVRIKPGEVVKGGDLIQSSGVEGCGEVMDDDSLSAIAVKKRHVATITAAVPSQIYPGGPLYYDDKSYIVPCTLHCG